MAYCRKRQCNCGGIGEGTWLVNHRNNLISTKIIRQQGSQTLPIDYVLNNHVQPPKGIIASKMSILLKEQNLLPTEQKGIHVVSKVCKDQFVLTTGCPILVRNKYWLRHDEVCANLHYSVCKALGIETTNKWRIHTHTHTHTYTHPNRYMNKNMLKSHGIKSTHREVTANMPDIIIISKQREKMHTDRCGNNCGQKFRTKYKIYINKHKYKNINKYKNI